MKHKTGIIFLLVGGALMVIGNAIGTIGVFEFLQGWAVEDMPVEAARFQDYVRRPVRDVEQPAVDHVHRELAVVVVGVDEQAEAGVFLVLGADGPTALLANRPQRRHENAQQKRNDGDNYEKLDECESSFSIHRNHPAVLLKPW